MKSHDDFRKALAQLPNRVEASRDYQIAGAVGPTYLARSPQGAPSLLVPFESVSQGIGRSGGGFSLTSAAKVAFELSGKRWEQPAAILECIEPSLFDIFLVLASDIAQRLSVGTVTWANLVTCVEDWQELLGKRSALSVESQLGLWGELWLITQSAHPDSLVAAWRGPERDAVDFFLQGVGIEVKTSRQRRVHHISQSQVDRPKGDFHAFVCSIWVGVDPQQGRSLPELVEHSMKSVSDPAELLRLVGSAGYAPIDREQYPVKYLTLDSPLLFRADDVPRVRVADHGISQLRYVVALDQSNALRDDDAAIVWQRFLGRPKPILS